MNFCFWSVVRVGRVWERRLVRVREVIPVPITAILRILFFCLQMHFVFLLLRAYELETVASLKDLVGGGIKEV